MPELPEVETIARELAPALIGRRITDLDIRWPRTVDRPALPAFRDALIGAAFTHVGRRGKFLVMDLDTAQHLLVHLRMSGRFSLRQDRQAEEHPHIRLRLQLSDNTWVAYIDQRKFGRFYLVNDPSELLADLGPEPLDSDFTAEVLCERLKHHRGEIKRLLLNQQFIAGLGNIYVSEALWQAGIHPAQPADTLSDAACRRLHDAIVRVIQDGIAHGGTSLEDRQYIYPNGMIGEHQHHLNVYDQSGEQCPRCGYTLQRMVQGQRSTYFCPICQSP
jgi:formamidopyrimidine-DNA glycosylase